ncbi:hypothetical protein P7C70_g910, partial [Phenoliferia sp. Uapishka_3]
MSPIKPAVEMAKTAGRSEEGGGSVKLKGFAAGTASGLTKLVVGRKLCFSLYIPNCPLSGTPPFSSSHHPPKRVSSASKLTPVPGPDPFDTIKLRLQCSPPSTYLGPLDCLLRTIRLEGPRALYKGASPPAVGWAVSDAVLLGSLHNYRLWLEKLETGGKEKDGGTGQRLSLGGHMLAGAMAGWTNASALFVWETSMRLMGAEQLQ